MPRTPIPFLEPLILIPWIRKDIRSSSQGNQEFRHAHQLLRLSSASLGFQMFCRGKSTKRGHNVRFNSCQARPRPFTCAWQVPITWINSALKDGYWWLSLSRLQEALNRTLLMLEPLTSLIRTPNFLSHRCKRCSLGRGPEGRGIKGVTAGVLALHESLLYYFL